MFCNNQITYVIRAGDTLYQLAKNYNTTVAQILAVNPYINPNNLQIGSTIIIPVPKSTANFVPKNYTGYPMPPICNCPLEEPVSPIEIISLNKPMSVDTMTWNNELPTQTVFKTSEFNPQMTVSSNMPFQMNIPHDKTSHMTVSYMDVAHPDMASRNDTYSNKHPKMDSHINLSDKMRLAWSQHVYWTRMFLISTAERLKDQSATTNRLLQNPHDIAAIFGKFYPREIEEKVAALFTEHLQIGGDLIVALRDKKMQQASELNRKWFVNADKIAEYFSKINPDYNHDELQKMMYNHLNLTSQEVNMRLQGNYAADIEVFNKVENEAMEMADYFTKGLKSINN